MSTLPHRGGQQNYLTGSIVGHGTLRRPQQQQQSPHDLDTQSTIPRSLTRSSADNAQYYYGWHLIKTDLTSLQSQQPPPSSLKPQTQQKQQLQPQNNSLNETNNEQLNVNVCQTGRTYCF